MGIVWSFFQLVYWTSAVMVSLSVGLMAMPPASHMGQVAWRVPGSTVVVTPGRAVANGMVTSPLSLAVKGTL